MSSKATVHKRMEREGARKREREGHGETEGKEMRLCIHDYPATGVERES